MKYATVPAKWSLLALASLASLGLVGCSKAKFEKQEFKATAQAGQYSKPKIDIIVFQDNSSSMMAPMQTIKSQFNNFVTSLESRWDYHFVVLPLHKITTSGYYPLTSKYILASDCSSVNSAYCLNSNQKNTFNTDTSNATWINSFNSAIGSNEVAFQDMTANLAQTELDSTGFIRPDATLAIVTITNGEDRTIFDGSQFLSGPSNSTANGAGVVSGCFYDPTGFYVTPNCQQYGIVNYAMPEYVNAAAVFHNYLDNYRPANMKKIYTVASAHGGACYGSNSYQGRRFIDLTLDLGGAWYDFCDSNALSNVMSNIRYDLDSLIEAYVFNYVVLDSPPIESSIKIYKNGVLVPNDPVNGWSYDAANAYKVNYPTVTYPQPSNNRTGYFIKMNGSFTYKGNDVISVDYQRQ